MKTNYQAPEVTLLLVSNEDILRTSTDNFIDIGGTPEA